MSQTPTPETDALEASLVALGTKYPASDNASFVELCTEQLIAKCRALESERNAARAERDRLKADITGDIADMTLSFIAERDGLDAQLAISIADRGTLRAALELIAAPMRPDGSYNRDREACGILAREALNTPAQ